MFHVLLSITTSWLLRIFLEPGKRNIPVLAQESFTTASLCCFEHGASSYALLEEEWKKPLLGRRLMHDILVLHSFAPLWRPQLALAIEDGPPPSNEELWSTQPVLWAAEEVGIHSRISG